MILNKRKCKGDWGRRNRFGEKMNDDDDVILLCIMYYACNFFIIILL